MPLLTVSPTVLQRVAKKEKVATTLYFTIPTSGQLGGKVVIPSDGKVVLAVYDLHQYLSVQGVLKSGFREDDETFFDGTRTDFDGSLQAHDVRANSGVLFVAELEFARREVPKSGIAFFVKQVRSRKQQADPAYEMRILTDTRVDADGNDQPDSPIQLGPIGIVAAAREDFDDFKQSEDTTRVMVFRLLTPDLKTVLLSSKNPAHSSAGVAIKRVLYSPSDSPKPIGAAGNCNDVEPTPKSRFPKDDPTGYYVEILPGQNPDDPISVTAPGVLWIHQLGRVCCGWYYPLRSQLLQGKKPISGGPIIAGDVSEMLSQNRLMFTVDVFLPNTPLQKLPRPAGAGGMHDIVFCQARTGADREDPDELILSNEADGSPVIGLDRQKTGLIQLEPEELPGIGREIVRAQVSLDGTNFSLFRKIDPGARLSWRAFRALQKDPQFGNQQEFLASIIEDSIEPLPPGVTAELTREVISPAMLALIQGYVAAKSNPPSPAQLVAEGAINAALQRLAADLRLTSQDGSLPPNLLLSVRAVARQETIQDGAKERSILEILEEIAGDLLERSVRAKLGVQPPTPLPPGRPNKADYDAIASANFFSGFSAFDIRPSGSFIYKFTFTEIFSKSVSVPRFVMVKGTAGVFNMAVEKLDGNTRLPDPAFLKRNFICMLAGGSVGAGLDFTADGVGTSDQTGKTGPAGAPAAKPVDCEIRTFLQLAPEDFDFARFTFFSQIKPGVSIDTLIGAGLESGLGTDTIFSITLSRLPSVTLETVIDAKVVKLKIKKPTLKRILDDIEKAAKGDKTVLRVKVQAMLYALTLVYGIAIFSTSRPPVQRPVPPGTVDDGVDKTVEAVVAAAGPSFVKNCASLNESSRKFLDICLAVQRKLLEYPGYIDIEGLASPEFGTLSREDAARENRELSLRRAKFVRACVFAAAGSPGTGVIQSDKEIVPSGLGSDTFALKFVTDPAIDPANTLLDPFARQQQPSAAKQKEYDDRLARERKEVYPRLRRVDMTLNGLFAVRFNAE